MRLHYIGRVHKDGWTQWELDHIARHSVTAAEVEESLTPPLRVVTIDADVQGVFGQTMAGRYLFIVVTESIQGHGVFVTTARDMTQAEISDYRRAKKKGR